MAILAALTAVILVSLLGAFEYVQVSNLESQNRAFSSMITRYNSEIANYTRNNSTDVAQSWILHLSKLDNRDTNGTLDDYTPNATVIWSGTTQGLGDL